MSEENKDLNVNEETESVQSESGKEEEGKKTIGQKISNIDPEEVGKKFDDGCNWISKKWKEFKGDTSTEAAKKTWRKKKRSVIMTILVLTFFSWYGGKGPSKLIAPYSVKTGTPNGYDITYEDAFNAICKSSSWEYIGYHNGNSVVEYNGKLKSDGSPMCIQFGLDGNGVITVLYMDIDGEAATNLYDVGITMSLLFEAASATINGNTLSNAANSITPNKVVITQVAAPAAVNPALIVPEIEDDYVFDPNGAVRADSYFEEESAYYYTEEDSGDLPDDYSGATEGELNGRYGEGDLVVPDETTVSVEEEYEPDIPNR